MYWRPSPIESLPEVPFEVLKHDESLPEFPYWDLDRLTGLVDASHAGDLKTRRSITGLLFMLAGASIAYKSKVQATVATSSSESELIAAVSAAKIAKYLRSVLKELGFEQDGPTTLYEDNKAAIDMINHNKPTPRTRHVDIQYFAIQEWRERGIIKLAHIPGSINSSDAGTKGLGWILHHRHVRRGMGHFGRPVRPG